MINGVQYGGVISVKYVNSFIDLLLNELSTSGYGCHIGDTYMCAHLIHMISHLSVLVLLD